VRVCEEIIKFSPLFLKSPICDKAIMVLVIMDVLQLCNRAEGRGK
jgi:hypothetical protein